MEFFRILSNAGIAALLSLLVSIFPFGAGLAYLLSPTEARLALLRPISLAGIFAALGGTILGFINVLRMIGMADPPPAARVVAIGSAEALVPLFVGFACLTAAWLCVAAGMKRRP
ncbi:MAG: hypothetical protein ABI665_17635 [Vicinamibacterales bacterium]